MNTACDDRQATVHGKKINTKQRQAEMSSVTSQLPQITSVDQYCIEKFKLITN